MRIDEALEVYDEGELPEDWRIANVVPLFKKGYRDNPGNYRPEVMKVIDEAKAVDVCMDFGKAFVKSLMVDWYKRVEGAITQGHRFKVQGGKFKRDVRGKFFTQRVVGAWNALPEEVVEADTIAAYKKHLDGYMNRKGIERYGSCGAVSAVFHSKVLGVTKVLNAYPVESLNLSFGVPSTLQGLRLLHQEYGSLSWAKLFQQPVELARKGFPVDSVLVGAAKEVEAQRAELCPLLCNSGHELKGAGVNATNWKLADILERVSTEMEEASFPEPLARQLAGDLPRKGRQEFVRAVTRQRATLAEPLVTELDRFFLYAAPPPASGGVLTQVVKEAGRLNLSLASISSAKNTSATYRDILNAAQRVYQSRPGFPSPVPWNLQKQSEDKPSNKTSPAGSQVVVIDRSGNMLAMVGSLNSAFGVRFLSPSTGIFLSDFTGRTDSVIHHWACPAVLTSVAGDDLVAMAGAGGSSVPFAVAQMVVNKVYFERSTKEAVSGPCFYLNIGEGGTLHKLVSGVQRDSKIYTLLLQQEPELELVNETSGGVTATMVGIHLGHLSAFGQPQECLYADVDALVAIFPEPLDFGKVLEDLKTANLSCLHKKGNMWK
eukprot:g46916.t1